jgi:penicillin amidase
MNIPANNPVPAAKLGMEWVPKWRFERIKEILERPEKKTLQDMAALQTDYLSIPARKIVLLLKDTQTQDLRVSEAITLLRNWDFRLTPESPAAALFQVWYDRHLGPAVVGLRTPPEAVKLIGDIDSNALLAVLEHPAGRAQRDALFVGTLRNAMAEMEQRQGTNWLQWSWGKLHQMEFIHPLSSALDADTAKQMNLAARSRGGGAFTVNANSYPVSTMKVTGGASFRMVLDVGNWDNALAFNVPGQSGDPKSKHYGDLFDLWSKDTAFPLLYSRAAIEKVTEMKIQLTPAK